MLFFVNVTNRDLLIMEVLNLLTTDMFISNSVTCFGSYIYVHTFTSEENITRAKTNILNVNE